VLLGIDTDIEGGDIDQLLAHANVALFNQDTGMVDRLGKALLEHLGLQTALEELLGGKLQDEIELKFILGEESIVLHAAEEGFSLEHALGIVIGEGEEGTGGLSKLGEGELHTPDLALAAEAIFTNKLELGIQTLLLVGTTGRLGRLPVVPVHSVGRHGY